MKHSGCPSVPATFVAYGMRYRRSAFLGKMPRNPVCRLLASPWHQQCRAAAWSCCSSACRHHQPSPSPWQGTEDSSLTLLLPGPFEAGSAGVQRAYDEKAEQKKLKSTEAFWEEQHVSIVLSSCSWDHWLLLMKVAACYILNGNTMMTQREKKKEKR